MKLHAKRGEEGAEFDDRRSYVAARTYGTVIGGRLCNAIEYAASSSNHRSRLAPWVTPVLGSGCLIADDPSETGRRIQHVPDMLASAILQALDLEELTASEAAQAVRSFASSLLLERLDRQPEKPPPHLQTTDNDLSAALVVLAAALTNRLYHEIRAVDWRAHGRAKSSAAVLTRGPSRFDEIEDDVLKPLRRVLDVTKYRWVTQSGVAKSHGESPGSGSANEQADDEDHQRTVQYLGTVLDDIRASIGVTADGDTGPRVDNTQVELISELAWFVMTSDTSTYPGWSDLLLRLSMLVGTRGGRASLRPRITDMTQPPHWITSRLQSVTEASWSSLQDRSQPSQRDRLYQSVAALLRAQAGRRLKATKREMPPFASGFITSFDLELEMALWHQSSEAFVVAVPVLALLEEAPLRLLKDDQAPIQVMSTWVGCRIDPNHELEPAEQLRRLQEPDEWFLLNERNLDNRYPDVPVVVHLAGCPLLRLPDLASEGQTALLHDLRRLLGLGDLIEEGASGGVELRHAVLLDEYATMQYATSEVFRTSTTGEKSAEVRYGLPLTLTDATSTYTRFWLVLGVQVNDTSVRLRLASQLAAPRWLTEQKNDRPEPNRAGVMVNRHTELASHELLYWSGFDVVHESCERWRGEIDHLVQHVQDGRRSERGQRCPLS